jgi:Carboxypeptidase regulatory-like domain
MAGWRSQVSDFPELSRLARRVSKYVNRLPLIAGLLVLSLVFAQRAFAQEVANAQIHGTVRDATGAAVVGARIRATQIDTGHIQATASEADGNFLLPDLPVGSYMVEVTAPSFSRYLQTGIVLEVGQNVQINIPMAVGSVSEEVRVTADANMVETQETSVSEVIDQKRIVDIPLNGRQITDMVLLSGGAAAPPNGPSRVVTSHDYPNSAAISVSGGQINGNNYLLDGADHNDSHSNINMPFPFPDALEEFSVQTSGVSARYGLHPGSVINVVTKSGANSIHGDLFEFVRNGDLNARFYPAVVRDSLKRNQYGGTAGGPILKNKLFLFGGYQETAIRTAPATSTAFVPTQQELNGDFTTEESAACQSTGAKTLINPVTAAPYSPANMIPTSQFTKPSLALVALMPVSSDPCGKLIFAIPNPSNEYQIVSRMDWNLSKKNTVMARYFILDYSNPPILANNILTTARAGSVQRAQSIVLGDTYTPTTNLASAFHLGFTRLAIHRNNPSNMPNMQALGSNVNTAAPNFIDLSVTSFFTVGGSSNAPANYIRNQWQYADDVDWVHGRNHYSFGGEFIAGQMDATNLTYGNGEFNFAALAQTTAQKAASQAQNALADYLVGDVNTFLDSNLVVSGLRQKYVGAYIQDDLQFKNLHIHAGLRWEPFLPEYDAGGRGNAFSLPNFIAGTRTSLYTNAPPGLLFHGDPGIPKAYTFGSYNTFAPRLGLAWDPTGSGKESIRASFGLFFDQPESYTNSVFALDAPWGNTITLTTPAGGLVNPFSTYPGGNPYPIPVPPTASSVFPTAASYYLLPLNAHHPYMEQYGLSLERQVGKDWVFDLDYLGNKGTHLRAGYEQNPSVYISGSTANTQARRKLTQLNTTYGPFYGSLPTVDDGVNTNYNALRVSAKHRFDHSYSILAVYTYSKCLQDTETLPNKIAVTESNPNNKYVDHGPCDFDLRNNFVASVIYDGFKFRNRALDLAAGGWRIAFVENINSGFPINPLAGSDVSLSGVGLDRPNRVPGINPYIRNNATHQYLNPAAFTTAATGTFGNAGANSLVGPHYVDTDANLSKLFRTHEEQNLQLRFEFFDLFNHTNYGLPVASLSSATFGQILASSNTTSGGRILQLAAKYTF